MRVYTISTPILSCDAYFSRLLGLKRIVKGKQKETIQGKIAKGRQKLYRKYISSLMKLKLITLHRLTSSSFVYTTEKSSCLSDAQTKIFSYTNHE
jgi:hypothetical protein